MTVSYTHLDVYKRQLWNIIPAQLTKENKKFIYGIIKEGARSKDYETALMWLTDCGLVHKVYRVTAVSYTHLYLLDETIFTRGLSDWLYKECGLPDLGQKLNMLQKNKEKPEAFVTAIFEYTGYFRQEEIQETERLVRVSADVSLVEKQKARADYFLESRRYVLAMQEYRNLLQDGDALAPDFSGKIYHNLGTAQAKLFLFEKAAASFEQAYRLTGDPESLFQYRAAMRLHLKVPEYLNRCV